MLKVSTASEDSDDKVKETELSPTNLSKHFSSTGDYDKQLALHTSSRTADESIVTLGSELPENENEIETYNRILDNAGESPNDGTSSNNKSIISTEIYNEKHNVDIAWKNINFVLPIKDDKKNLRGTLVNVSGGAKAGNVTAIMGPTGCGKTSLLNVLAGRVQRVRGAELSGSISIGGTEISANRGHIAVNLGYVTQDDVLFPFFTVEETLDLAASFYLPSNISKKTKREIVENIIKQLGLAKVINTVIGNQFVKGVSGGEKKRVCIGIELISNPPILFLDEPTSGLDAFQSLAVMQALKDLAQTGRTIVTVIHQPRAAIYDLVDDLTLLSEGYCLYTGKTKDASLYFENLGFKAPAFCTISDYFLDCISMDYRTNELEEFSKRKIFFFAQKWASHSTDNLSIQDKKNLLDSQNPQEEKKYDNSQFISNKWLFGNSPKASLVVQFKTLLWRSFQNAKRNIFSLLISTVLSIVFGIMFGGIFSENDKGVQDKVGLLLLCTINAAFGGMGGVLNVFPVEKNIIKKERVSNAYYLFIYFLAKITTEVPFNLFPAMLFIVLVYFMTGLERTLTKFLNFTFLLLVENLCAMSAGLWISSLSPTVEVANAIAPALNIIFTLFNGFFITMNDLPNGTKWIADISFTKYVFEGLMYNEFNGQTNDDCNQPPCMTGEQLLTNFGYQDANILLCAFYTFIIGCVFTLLAYLSLWLSSEKYMDIIENPTKFPAMPTAFDVNETIQESDMTQEKVEKANASLGIEEQAKLPSKGIFSISISWENINFHIAVGKKTEEKNKTILTNISGSVKTGTLAAILGPSGSGKTSLLNILANRVTNIKRAVLTGKVSLNEKERDDKTFKEISAYVTQHDVLYSFLTVHQTLSLAAKFYYGKNITETESNALVEDIITSLGLSKCKDSIIGDENARGVSGGERKRVSIGVEMVSNPSILFLDEPTSGLDSFQALSVMSVMASLANSGRTVLASIHQPRTSIYNKLNSIILMSEGRTIYIGSATEAIKYFESANFFCPQSVNIADFFLDNISMDYRSAALEAASRERIKSLHVKWEKHNLSRLEDMEGGNLIVASESKISEYSGRADKVGWFFQLYYLLWRQSIESSRNFWALRIRIMQSLLFGLIFGSIWSKDLNQQSSIQSIAGLFLLCTLNVAFTNCAATLNVFPKEKAIVRKEEASNLYSFSAYYLSKLVAEGPINVLIPCIFASLIFWISGLPEKSFATYIFFTLLVVCSSLCGISEGIMLSAIAPNAQIGQAMMPPVNVFAMLFSGVMINVESLPVAVRWIANISFVRWVFEGLLLNQLKDYSGFQCPEQTNSTCLFKTGEDVLELYSFQDGQLWLCYIMSLVTVALFLSVGYYALWANRIKYMPLGKASQ